MKIAKIRDGRINVWGERIFEAPETGMRRKLNLIKEITLNTKGP